MTGRGAWPNDGQGGTIAYRPLGGTEPLRPGSYYYLTAGSRYVAEDVNSVAVRAGVKAIQRALNRNGAGLTVDGVYGDRTYYEVLSYQQTHTIPDTTPWGGVGPDTSRALFMPLVRDLTAGYALHVTWTIVAGIISTESSWDPGCVGQIDPNDLGLVQINGPSHPDMTRLQRLMPAPSIRFAIRLMDGNYSKLRDMRDAVAAYNLGIGGVQSWIGDGRPDVWTPPGQSQPRNVKAYIDRILQGGLG